MQSTAHLLRTREEASGAQTTNDASMLHHSTLASQSLEQTSTGIQVKKRKSSVASTASSDSSFKRSRIAPVGLTSPDGSTTPTTADARMDRMMRNRAAAQESREKKRRYVAELEERNKFLQAENEELNSRMQVVEKENAVLSGKFEALSAQLKALTNSLAVIQAAALPHIALNSSPAPTSQPDAVTADTVRSNGDQTTELPCVDIEELLQLEQNHSVGALPQSGTTGIEIGEPAVFVPSEQRNERISVAPSIHTSLRESKHPRQIYMQRNRRTFPPSQSHNRPSAAADEERVRSLLMPSGSTPLVWNRALLARLVRVRRAGPGCARSKSTVGYGSRFSRNRSASKQRRKIVLKVAHRSVQRPRRR